MSDGFPVVLTADRTLTADYRLLFDGMLAASQTTTAPPQIFGPLLMPHRRSSGVRARVAPLGLRRIEAALLGGGFSPEEIVVANEDQLDRAIGRDTRVIGISSGEPAGFGMNTSTMTAVAGGTIYPEAMFRRLMRKIHRLNRNASAKIVLGGPGAWQAAPDRPGGTAGLSSSAGKTAGQASSATPLRMALGIDHIMVGYAEDNAAAVFRGLLRQEAAPEIIPGGWNPTVPIPPIRGASTMGVVEISRGCGLGCSFCTIGRVPMVHLPPQTILADVQTNLAAGLSCVAALSEDFFRYGGEGMTVRPEVLIGLLQEIRRLPRLRLIQIDHANVSSVAQYDDRQLETIHNLLVGDDRGRYVWVNLGIESVSEDLLRTVGAGPKIGRRGDERWGDLCAGQLRRLCRAKFFPMASLMIGLPGETDEHLRETLAWVESLVGERLAVFPVVYAPVDGGPPPDPRELRPLHWALIRACYRLNFRWVPWFYWDNQAAAGTPLVRRTALQLMGRGQVLQWKALFAWHAWRARR
jgi:radical SAM superfamily enzyme YgiQ (UPF0313 family)